MRRGGRPAVQDPAVAEIFYESDPFRICTLPEERCLLEYTGDAALSTLHYSPKSGLIVLRAYNPSDKTIQCGIRRPGIVGEVRALTLDEVPINDILMGDGDSIELDVERRKILTLGLKMDGSDE